MVKNVLIVGAMLAVTVTSGNIGGSFFSYSFTNRSVNLLTGAATNGTRQVRHRDHGFGGRRQRAPLRLCQPGLQLPVLQHRHLREACELDWRAGNR